MSSQTPVLQEQFDSDSLDPRLQWMFLDSPTSAQTCSGHLQLHVPGSTGAPSQPVHCLPSAEPRHATISHSTPNPPETSYVSTSTASSCCLSDDATAICGRQTTGSAPTMGSGFTTDLSCTYLTSRVILCWQQQSQRHLSSASTKQVCRHVLASRGLVAAWPAQSTITLCTQPC